MGADLALVDQAAQKTRPRGRTIFVTGDGSMTLTVQEVGNMVKLKLAPVVFVINNAGCTIERIVHMATAIYNDIVPFNYSRMPPVLKYARVGNQVQLSSRYHQGKA